MSIQGKVIVFTGKISKPRHEFQALVEEHGGINGGGVTSKTDYLVVGEKPGSKLFVATSLGVPTISEAKFLEILEEPEQATPSAEFTDYCGTGFKGHYWFQTTTKPNGDVVKDCLCGTILIQHPNGTWEKHEPRHVIEQAKKIAHAHAVQEERECRERQRKEEENERKVMEQLDKLSPEEIEELERQINKGKIIIEYPNGTTEENNPHFRYTGKEVK